MNIATLAYLPPDHVPYAKAFRTNIRQFKTEYPVTLFSDTPDSNEVVEIQSPEKFRKAGRPFTISNHLFLVALRLAVTEHRDYLILMEADCRVNGDYWDKRIVEDFLSYGGSPLVGGTPVCWNLNHGSRALTMSIIDFAAKAQKIMGVPMALHGVLGGLSREARRSINQPCLYPNGAAAIYSVPLLAELFPAYMYDATATAITAWDMHLGYMLLNKLGDDLPSKIAILSSVFSGYGDEILAEHERRDWLTSGRVCAVHQIKTNWTP